MSIKAVIGKNFGDEGKGLATDYLAMLSKRAGHSCIVVRHNGGAQAGHTVEASGKRFIFREISSGTLRGADTLWAPTFMPDLLSPMGSFTERYWPARKYGSAPPSSRAKMKLLASASG